jgi:monoamine oxidase
LLCTPDDNTLFFAGEALYDGDSPGTVEAALASGKDAAKKLRKSIG